METKEKLEVALKEAMRAGDDVRKRSVRMVLAAVRQVEIDRQIKLDEAAVLGIIQKEIKTRRESVEEARGANRPDRWPKRRSLFCRPTYRKPWELMNLKPWSQQPFSKQGQNLRRIWAES